MDSRLSILSASCLIFSLLSQCRCQVDTDLALQRAVDVGGPYNGPVSITFISPSELLVTKQTYVSHMDLNSRESIVLIGSAESGGYVDGRKADARFTEITDVAVQGNRVIVADGACIRQYDTLRDEVATLAGSCAKLTDQATTINPPTFSGSRSLKVAASASVVYVLDGSRIVVVDQETGAVSPLSQGELLSKASASDIALDRYSNTLFVAVVNEVMIMVVAVDIASGRQSKYQDINRAERSLSDQSLPIVNIASIDVSPDGTVVVLDPNSLHKINRDTMDVTTTYLQGYGHYSMAVSSQYVVIVQEYYSKMYRLHIAEVPHATDNSVGTGASSLFSEVEMSQKLLYTVVGLSCVVLLTLTAISIILIKKCASQQKSKKHDAMTESDTSERYFLNPESRHWI